MILALVTLLASVVAEPACDTVVVCPAEFRQALAPWVAHREAQGHHLALVSNLASPEQLREDLRQRGPSVRYLVLVGDADPGLQTDTRLRARSVPTQLVPAKINVRYGSEPSIASDNWLADLDGDRLPDMAVGRLPADTPGELAVMVQKILAYERCTDFGPWRRQVHFVAGLGGWGALTDAILEAAAKSVITEGVPASVVSTMTYGSWQSPYCPDPRQFGKVALERLNEGSLFWIYIGHGNVRELDRVWVPGGSFPILSSADVPSMNAQHGSSIACLLACYGAAFDQPRDCLGEEMLRAPGGPVAVLAGTRVTLPYALSVIGAELLEQAFVARPATLGEAFMNAKRRTMAAPTGGQRLALESVAMAFYSSPADLAAERAEHLDLFTLLGDPLLRLPYPRELTIDCPTTICAGDTLHVEGRSPLAGTVKVELVVRRDRLTFQPPRRGQFDPRALDAYDEVYRRANDARLVTVDAPIESGRFAVAIAVPPAARGACHVRAYVAAPSEFAAGAANVQIEAPGSTTSQTDNR